MSILRPLLGFALAFGSAAGSAQEAAPASPDTLTITQAATAEAPTGGTVYRLSPDEIAKIDPNPRAQDPKLAYDPLFDRSLFDNPNAAPRDRRAHGQVGAFVGSGGSNGVFGTTTVPIGDTGSASFSFENSNYGGGRRYRRR